MSPNIIQFIKIIITEGLQSKEPMYHINVNHSAKSVCLTLPIVLIQHANVNPSCSSGYLSPNKKSYYLCNQPQNFPVPSSFLHFHK